jgi:hypothetical protein
MMLSAREAGELSHIERRLVAKFVPPLPYEVVRRCIEASAARHASARVRTYLSILIERTAIELLATELRAMGEPTAVDATVVDLRARVALVAVPGDEGAHVQSGGREPDQSNLAVH